MAHGAGGRQTSELIDQIFAAHFANPDLTADDAAVLTPPAGKMAVSTDGFIVSPAFFPGGNIGKLSICGTVNDLACMGAKPLYLTCAFVIEEGFPMEKLEEIVSAMEKTAAEAGVHIVSGDTKVAGKGQVDGVFITTTGMGQIEVQGTIGEIRLSVISYSIVQSAFDESVTRQCKGEQITRHRTEQAVMGDAA